jgi:hypothetical protein
MTQELSSDVIQVWADIIRDDAEPLIASGDRCIDENHSCHQTLSKLPGLCLELCQRLHRRPRGLVCELGGGQRKRRGTGEEEKRIEEELRSSPAVARSDRSLSVGASQISDQ